MEWFVLSSCNQRVVGSNSTRGILHMPLDKAFYSHIVYLEPGVVNGYLARISSLKCIVRH